MAASPVTIRNLTAQPLTIQLIERFEAPHPQDLPGQHAKSARNFTSLFGRSLTKAQLEEKAQKYARHEVDIRMEPFTTRTTDAKATKHKPDEMLRLTIHGDGEESRWRIDVPAPAERLCKLLSLVPGPAHEYSTMYFPDISLLVVMESPRRQPRWMKDFKDETPLSALSIPGTHNSCTHHKALPSVRCQAVHLDDQLNHGIRFFDIRVQPTNPKDKRDDSLSLVHGAFPVSLTGAKKFRDEVNEVLQFLKEFPSETVIMSLKREGTGSATDAQLSEILFNNYVARNPLHWYTKPRIPSLGEARGKIIIMRRFALSKRLRNEHGGRGWCIDAENWDYNTLDCIHGDVRVQDFCEVLETINIDKKIGYCCDHFERAAQVICPVPGVTTDAENPVPPGPLYLNFLSASNFWRSGCWPERIAARLNPAVARFLCEKHHVGDEGVFYAPGRMINGDGGVGIVVCDWVGRDGDWDLVRTILAMNARLLLRQRTGA